MCRIFFAAHVAEENDWTFFAPAGANSMRFFDKQSGAPFPERRFAVILFSHSGKTPTESWRSARGRRAPADAGS